MTDKLPTCCEYHGYGESGCREGTDCPEGRVDLRAIATRRVQEAEARWPRDIAMGDESGRPDLVQPPREAKPMAIQYAGDEPFDWQLIVVWIGVCVAFGTVAALTFGPQIAELIDTLWPRLVYVASF